MPPLEIVATGMEISIATLMLLFTGFLVFGSGQRSIPAFSLATITGVIGVEVLLSMAGSHNNWEWLRAIKPPVALLAGPALYIYVSTIRQGAPSVQPGMGLHALLAVGSVLLLSIGSGQVTDIYLNFWIGGYWIASAVYFFRHRSAYKPETLGRFVLWLTVIFGVVYISDVVISYQAQRIAGYRDLPAYTLGLSALLIGAARMIWTALQNAQLLVAPASGIKYARAGLDASGIDSLGRRFEVLMDMENAYLKENVSLTQVALQLDAQPRHVSQMVNTRYGRNFSSYINQRRIYEAAARLHSLEDNGVSITEIMYDTGFQSKSTFNREFKRHFGMSPKDFRERHHRSG